jgi:RNA polymerase sigma-70 factor (ECF subfamily)
MKTESDKQELRWVLYAQAGDRASLDALLQRVQEPLYRYVYHLVGSQPLAEDVLQEVFILIYRKLKWLREPELFRPWAYRIATREAFKQLKREKRWRDASVEEDALAELAAPERQSYRAEVLAQLPQLVARLSPSSRAVIVLHYLHEWSLPEIAEMMDVALGTVKSRLAYGLSSLRKQLE